MEIKRSTVWKFIIGGTIALFLLLAYNIYNTENTEYVDYNTFVEKVENDEIETALFDDFDNIVTFTEKDSEITYYTYNPKTDTFREFLLKHDVEIAEPLTMDWSIIISFASLVVMASFIISFMRGKGIGPSTGMSSHKVDVDKSNRVTLNDVACNSDIKKEMIRIIDYLKRPEFYREKSAKFPNGVLLYGPPGTGKTMIAKAIASEANCSFYSLAGSDFVEMYVGRGASRVRNLFAEARKNSPAIIFIDEIDAIGRKRGKDNNSETDQTINALLNELDGFSSRDNIMVIAATNRLEDMDPALIRSGRFGKHIKIPLPQTAEDRMKIINIHKVKDAYDETVDFDAFARLTRGFSGADIAAILNDALLISISEAKEKVDKESLDKAFNQHIFEGHNDNKRNVMSYDEQRLVAYHEAGHAIVGKLLCNESIATISIIGTTSGAGGYTISTPDEDRFFETKSSLNNRIMMLYAGRTAERIAGYENSIGASNDIQRATELLDEMYYKYAIMEDEILLNYSVLPGYDNSADKLKGIEKASKELHAKTTEFLEEHRELLDILAETLLKEETIDEKQFEEIVKEYQSKKETEVK